MNPLKKSSLPFLAVMALLFLLLDFGGGEINYEAVYPENIPQSLREKVQDIGPGATGVVQGDDHNYALICTEPDEKVEFLSVGKIKRGKGMEVCYKIHNRQSVEVARIIHGHRGDYALYVIRLEKAGFPVRFTKVDAEGS